MGTTKKEQILEAALTLFSEKGYDGVGVDEIAANVGMKGPALYHYFKGKDALLDGLVEAMGVYYDAQFGSVDHIEVYPETLDEMIEMSMKRLVFTIHDPNIKKVRRMLMMEQFRNDKIRELTTLHNLTGVEKMNTIFLQRLMENGCLKQFDPALLAFELTAPVSIMVQLIDREPEKEAEAMEKIRRHFEHFKDVYGV